MDAPAAPAAKPDDRADPKFLRKLSESLRNRLSVPVAKVAPLRIDVQAQDVEGGMPLSAWQPWQQQQQQLQQQQLAQQPMSDRRGKGTFTGPYVGYASQPWLQSEVVKDVNELTRYVDQFVTTRERNAFAFERAGLQAHINSLTTKVGDLEESVAKLERIMPGENGEFSGLRRELAEIEQDCDYYYDLYGQEASARQGAQQAIRDAIARLEELDVEFRLLRESVEAHSVAHPPTGPPPPAAVPPLQPQPSFNKALQGGVGGINNSLAVGMTQDLEGYMHPAVAAELIDGIVMERRQRAWPNMPKIVVRTIIALLWLGSLAGAILGTYFITKANVVASAHC